MGSARSSNGGGSADRNNLQAQHFQIGLFMSCTMSQHRVLGSVVLSSQSSYLGLIRCKSHAMFAMCSQAQDSMFCPSRVLT